MRNTVLEMKNIRKAFPGVLALSGMNFDLYPGEVHALLGENGAGKSTLIKILSGIYSADEGEIYIDGEKKEISSPQDAFKNGIRTIHQELALVPYLSVAENIYLGIEIGKFGFVDIKGMERESTKMLEYFDTDFSASDLIESLTVAQQQLVEIIRAVSFNAKIIVMDEPTSALSDKETDKLFEVVEKLKSNNIGIIYISHRMSELEKIADRVTVLRDGEYIATKDVKNTSIDELVSLMVGRTIANYYVHEDHSTDEVVLKVENLTNDKVNNVSFELKRGEILGFAGLVGAGRTETMETIFGLNSIDQGFVELAGEKLNFSNPRQAIDKGIVLVPEDRKNHALFPEMTVKENLTLKVLKQFISGVHVDHKKEFEISNEQVDKLKIKGALDTLIGNLSGGNQQKVVVGSCTATNPKVILLDEPTRGIDVGAKVELYSIMNELTAAGISIIMVSSELPEVIGMSDRIIVMRNGEISQVLKNEGITQNDIMKHAVTI